MSWLELAIAPPTILAGLAMVAVTVHVAWVPEAVHEPAPSAWAAVTLAPTAPAVSRPVRAAQTTRRRDPRIINSLSAYLKPLRLA
jgi:hypothetical protein